MECLFSELVGHRGRHWGTGVTGLGVQSDRLGVRIWQDRGRGLAGLEIRDFSPGGGGQTVRRKVIASKHIKGILAKNYHRRMDKWCRLYVYIVVNIIGSVTFFSTFNRYWSLRRVHQCNNLTLNKISSSEKAHYYFATVLCYVAKYWRTFNSIFTAHIKVFSRKLLYILQRA